LAKKNSISFLWAHAWWSFSNPDLLIYLIIHGVNHEFARLIWVLDVARALADLSDDDLNEVFKLAKALGVEGAFLYQLRVKIQLGYRASFPGCCRYRATTGDLCAGTRSLGKDCDGPCKSANCPSGYGPLRSARTRFSQPLEAAHALLPTFPAGSPVGPAAQYQCTLDAVSSSSSASLETRRRVRRMDPERRREVHPPTMDQIVIESERRKRPFFAV
jgi:hypothetical protein